MLEHRFKADLGGDNFGGFKAGDSIAMTQNTQVDVKAIDDTEVILVEVF